ncbi:hypothetical protein C0989_009097, partial [Termitomyces sp. Mn162]
TRAQAKCRLENLIEPLPSTLWTPQHSSTAVHPRPLADKLKTTRNLCDVSKILADFPGAFIESFLDAPLSPLTPTNSLFFLEAQSIPSSPINPFLLLNLTIANMNNNPIAWLARMPPRNNTTVPKWDESCPRELPQYFKELEYLFTDCGIADDTQKKEYAARYVSYDMAETWLGLPEFGTTLWHQRYSYGKVRRNAEGKIVLPSGAMIPNYFGKRLYMERIEEWHRLNPGQIVTGRLSSNANPDPEQAAMQQSLIHEVMQQDIAMSQALSKEEWIEALEHKLFALR